MLLFRGAKYVSDKNYDKEELKCLSCGKEYLRIRKPSNIKKYRCGICNGKLDIEMLN